MSETKELFKALQVAQKNIKGVEKDSLNAFQKYKYASAEDMIAECRSALLSAGLVLLNDGWQVTEDNTTLLSSFWLSHPDSGESLTAKVPMALVLAQGKPMDKAITTALTYALGYFLRGLLLVPRTEEGTDVDQRDDKTILSSIGKMGENDLRKAAGAVKARIAELRQPGPDGPGDAKKRTRKPTGKGRGK